jgi:4-amino-4-deoxy-L-arabinose transferase-like glycosyltransferase
MSGRTGTDMQSLPYSVQDKGAKGMRTRGLPHMVQDLRPLAGIVIASVLLKATLVKLNAFDFTSDEGIISLMARHITQGKWPVFYYGEAYVGSLGATVTAGAFLLLGESVTTVRVVQTAFYIGSLLFTYLLAQRIFGRGAALVAALLMALPPVVVVLYSTVAVGAYGETLFFGSLLLWLGHRLAGEWADKGVWWLVWGAVAGLGFWSFGLIVVYLVPVVLLWLPRLERRHWRLYLLAVTGFLLCSSPWWIYDFSHNHAAFRVLYDPSNAVRNEATFSLPQRLVGFLLLGLPVLIGLRFPWQADYILVYLAPLVLTFYLVVLLEAGRRRRSLAPVNRRGLGLVLLFMAIFVLFFVGTRFGTDATGRYMLPLYPPLCILVGGWWAGLRPSAQRWGSVALALLVAFHLAGVALAASRPEGLTTQYNPDLQMGNAYDQALIDFLLENDMPYGYSHHWVSFKIAFLSQERVVLSPLLPSRINPYDDPARADRYPPYTALVESAANPVYVTSDQPWLDDMLRQRFAERGITFIESTIGPYRVFHHLSRAISPKDMESLFAREN